MCDLKQVTLRVSSTKHVLAITEALTSIDDTGKDIRVPPLAAQELPTFTQISTVTSPHINFQQLDNTTSA